MKIIDQTYCLVVTILPCDTPYPNEESPNGCCNCEMLNWWTAFDSELKCNTAYREQYPEKFDTNGNYIMKNKNE